ncbi:MAG: roadblock/LC7 domain-containing protein [Desulfuromonadaceae bacterium]|nr:roadblock/LC7 domain-containing protein [Desulfuromonadaceae bacterium]
MFKPILQTILDESSGALGVFLLGDDGIIIEQVRTNLDTADDQLALVVELAAGIKNIRQTAEVLEAGALNEVVVHYENLSLLVHVLNDEYFVVLLLEPNALSGKGSYLLKREARRLRAGLNQEI